MEAYEALADALEAAPRDIGALADAYREWALAQPHRYRLAMATPLGSGALAPDRVIPAAQRSMDVILAALAERPPAPPRPPRSPSSSGPGAAASCRRSGSSAG